MKVECRGCGSSLAYSAKDQNLRCSYCGTVTEIPRTEEELPDNPTVILPLTVELTGLTDAVHEHLASGDMTPDQLLEHATFTKKERFYAPAYEYQGNFVAKWTASFGYNRREEYTVYEKRHEDGQTYTVPVTKTRTVTDWRPASGTDTGDVAVLAYAGTQLLGTTANAVSLVENRSAAEAVSFDPSYTTGIPQEPYATSDDDAYHDRAESQINKIIDRSVRQHAQGDLQKDWHWTANINKNASTILIPICHAVYEYQGKSYHVWVSGTNASRLVADELPVDLSRKNSVNYGFLPLAVSAIASAFAVFSLGYNAVLPVCVVLAALLYGFLRKNAIINHSRNVRQFLLANRRAAGSNTAAMTSAEQEALVRKTVRPDKPWLAHTAYDHIVIPLIILIVALIPFSQYVMSSDTSPQTQYQTQQSSAADSSASTSAPAAQGEQNNSVQSPPAAEPSSNNSAAESSGSAEVQPPTVSEPSGDPSGTVSNDSETTAQSEGIASRQSAARKLNAEGRQLLSEVKLSAAKEDFERAVQLDPQYVEALNNLGFVESRMGEFASAESILLKVLDMSPTRKAAHGNLGYTEAKLGKVREATDHFCQYVRQFDSIERGKAALVRVMIDPDSPDPNVQKAVNLTLETCKP